MAVYETGSRAETAALGERLAKVDVYKRQVRTHVGTNAVVPCICLRRGNAARGHTYRKKAGRAGLQRLQDIAHTGNPGRAAHNGKRHVRAHLRAQRAQLCRGKARTVQLVQPHQNGEMCIRDRSRIIWSPV